MRSQQNAECSIINVYAPLRKAAKPQLLSTPAASTILNFVQIRALRRDSGFSQ
jgi:hypothetical protein